MTSILDFKAKCKVCSARYGKKKEKYRGKNGFFFLRPLHVSSSEVPKINFIKIDFFKTKSSQ